MGANHDSLAVQHVHFYCDLVGGNCRLSCVCGQRVVSTTPFEFSQLCCTRSGRCPSVDFHVSGLSTAFDADVATGSTPARSRCRH
jgi:hypothetical protein